MKKIVLKILLLVNSLLFSQEIKLFPEKIDITEYLVDYDGEKIRNLVGKELTQEGEIKKIETFDFDKDGEFEFIITLYDGGTDLPMQIYHKNIKTGVFSTWRTSFCELKNGMPQIAYCSYEGHKTNPVFYIEMYTFKDKRYIKERNSKIYFKDCRELGVKNYKSRNYQLAEIYFKNRISDLWFRPNLKSSDYNNLALTYIKQKKYNKATAILLDNIEKRDMKDGMTYFNLYKVEIGLKNVEKALEYLKKSNKLERTKFKTELIEEYNTPN